MRKIILTLICFLFLIFSYGQKEVYYSEYNYKNIKEGTYKIQSFSKELLKGKLPIVKPNIEILDTKKYPNFLNPNNKEIVLFENHNLKELIPVGKLIELTQVRVDSIIYKYKFKDLTNCVWNRIVINDKYYYTDADIHDFLISKNLNKLNQKLKIVGQNDGYDGNYHIGYPEYIFMIFTDNENKVIYKTNVLDLYLNNEFAMEEDILNLKWNKKSNSYEIILIGAEQKIKISWNGKTHEVKN